MGGLKVVREPEDIGPPFELCCKCESPTPYWHVRKDVPLCPACAAREKAGNIPTKDEWIAEKV